MGPLATILLLAAAGLFFVGVAVAVITVAYTSFGRIGVARGLRAIDKVYAASGAAAPQEESFGERVVSPMQHRVTKLGRVGTPARALERLRRWLDYAGNPPYWSVERIFEVKGLGLIVVLVVGSIAGIALDGVTGAVVGGILGAVLGFYIPDFIIYDLGDRRQNAIRRGLPDVIDTLTISVEAGLGFDAALAQVTRHGDGPVAGEFARMLQEMQIGMPRVDALRALALRTKVVEFKSFCTTMVQASDLGIPTANVLREQSKEMRIRRRQRAEETAQKVPVKILFPLIFCLFPALFVVVLGPAAINIANLFFGK
jgi:tight adherence protein C